MIEDLKTSGIEALWPPAAEGWYQQRPNGAYLRTVDGHCVFLREDRQCAVHDLLGGHRKPAFCREFPYHLVEDPLGWVAVVRSACRGFHHSHRDGQSVEDELPSILALPIPRRRFTPHEVSILDGASVPLAVWMEIEAALQERLVGLDFTAAVVHLRTVLHERADRTPPPVRPEQRAAALQAILMALTLIMRHTLSQTGSEDPDRRAFAERTLADLERLTDGLEDQAPPLAADAEVWVNLLLRSHLLGKHFAVWGGVCEGVGEMILAIEVSRRLAEVGEDGTVSAESLSAPLAHWRRFVAVGLITRILQKARPALIDLVLHAEGV